MDTLKAIDRLVQQANKETAPSVDVSGKVLSEIRMGGEAVRILPFTLFAGVSAAAAAVILFLAVNSWSYLTNPIMGLFAPLQEASLW